MGGSDQAVGVKAVDYAEHRYVELNAVRYAYLEAGTGPGVMFLHGYPDNAYTWEHQIRFFSRAGYRVLAPFLRGYAPTQTPPGSYFDRATLALDIAGLIERLNGGEPVRLVGQDWGAAIGYGVLGAYPDKVHRAVLLAVPHPVEIKRTLQRSPRHAIRSFHWFLFQLPWLPEWIIRGSRGRFLKFLWRLWSPAFDDADHVRHIVETMLRGRGVSDSLAYYRAVMQKRFRDPRLAGMYDRLDDPIGVPTRVLCGTRDMRQEMLPRQADLFRAGAEYHWRLIEGAGHFLHRERPAAVNREILDWLT